MDASMWSWTLQCGPNVHGVPKHNAAALTIVDEFVRDAKRDGLIAQAIITRAGLRAVHPAPYCRRFGEENAGTRTYSDPDRCPSWGQRRLFDDAWSPAVVIER